MQNLDVKHYNRQDDDYQETEDSEMEQHSEWLDNKIDLYDIANSAGQMFECSGVKTAALDDFFNKLKHLEHEWCESEKRYNELKGENEKLQNQLVHAKAKCTIYQKKLKFITDNHKNFAKLKEVYMNMKFQGGRMIDICEKSIQTTPVAVCLSSYSADAISVQSVLMPVHHESLISVKKSELNEAQQNLRALKDIIMKREQSWALSRQIEDGLKSEIRALQTQKVTLEEIVTIKDSEIDTLKSIQIKPSVNEENLRELKIIIAKVDRRMRDLEKAGKIGRYIVIFNERERQIVQEISEECMHERARSPSPSRKPPMMKSLSMTVQRPTRVMPQTLSSISEKRANARRNFFDEAKELEALQKIKRDIEAKQSALKEKVQEIIDYSSTSLTQSDK